MNVTESLKDEDVFAAYKRTSVVQPPPHQKKQNKKNPQERYSENIEIKINPNSVG